MNAQLFHLVRIEDVTGVSGTGVVAEGTQYGDGTVTLRWLGDKRSTSVWADLDTMLAVHGHDGATVVEWIAWADPQDVRYLLTAAGHTALGEQPKGEKAWRIRDTKSGVDRYVGPVYDTEAEARQARRTWGNPRRYRVEEVTV